MRVWVVNADGSGERRLDPLVDGCVLPPIWSPDGTRLLSLVIVDDYFHVGVLAPTAMIRRSSSTVLRRVVAAGSSPLPPAPSFPATP